MPTYEYRCTLCEHRFEAFQKMSDLPLTNCPHCSGPVQRIIGAGMGLIFKGSGFYITDYKKANASTANTTPADKPVDHTVEKAKVEPKTEKSSADGKSDKAAA